MPTKTGTPPSYSVDFKDRGQVSILHFSPYDVSQNILLVGLPNKILIGSVCIDDDLNFQILAEFNYGVYCSALALSPETIIDTPCPLLLFCAGGQDFDLNVFKSDLCDDTLCTVSTCKGLLAGFFLLSLGFVKCDKKLETTCDRSIFMFKNC